VSVVLDETTTNIFIEALKDPEMADTLSILANSTDSRNPEVIQAQAWKMIERTLGVTIYRWSEPIVTEVDDTTYEIRVLK
jgi:hypothetical protein